MLHSSSRPCSALRISCIASRPFHVHLGWAFKKETGCRLWPVGCSQSSITLMRPAGCIFYDLDPSLSTWSLKEEKRKGPVRSFTAAFHLHVHAPPARWWSEDGPRRWHCFIRPYWLHPLNAPKMEGLNGKSIDSGHVSTAHKRTRCVALPCPSQ